MRLGRYFGTERASVVEIHERLWLFPVFYLAQRERWNRRAHLSWRRLRTEMLKGRIELAMDTKLWNYLEKRHQGKEVKRPKEAQAPGFRFAQVRLVGFRGTAGLFNFTDGVRLLLAQRRRLNDHCELTLVELQQMLRTPPNAPAAEFIIQKRLWEKLVEEHRHNKPDAKSMEKTAKRRKAKQAA